MDRTMLDIVATNPSVDRDREVLEEALALVKELRKNGNKPAGYRLSSPFDRQRALEHSELTVHNCD